MKYILPLGVLAFVVTGFAYYTLVAGPGAAPEPVTERSVDMQTAATDEEPSLERTSFSGEGSINSLLARGESLECAITYIPNPTAAELTGNIFTFNGNLRGDFVVPTPDLADVMVTSIIIADGTIWQWTDIGGEVVGSTQAAAFDTATLERLVSPIGFVTNVRYDCLSWSQIDYTIFEAPTDVLFSDADTATFEEGVLFEEGEF